MATNRRASPRGGPIVWGIISAVLIVGLVLLVLSLIDLTADDPEPTDAQFGVAAGEILENPDEYRGETVTVSGQVNRVLSPLAYTIGGERFVDGQEMLIIGPPPPVGDDAAENEPLQEQDIVQVNGAVRDFDREAIEEELDVELDVEIPEEFHDQPVIVAQGSVISARVGPVGEAIDIDELLDNPDEYLGEQVTVDGDITETVGERAFILDDALPVIDATDTMTAQALQEADSAEVSGDVMEYDPAAIGDNVEGAVEEEWEQFEGRVVVVSDSIQLLPESAE